MSVLVSVTEVPPRGSGMGVTTPDEHMDLGSTLDGTPAPQGKAVVHRGSPMHVVTSAPGVACPSAAFPA
ncbi:hypothetical protein [Arthrobacter sp. SAFR-044]|uniref:hypothetical protein n=1 Tax=Arthrobacter sp. SAFR-044 TaxID=3387278 RepID=UPI003F7C8CB4